ncbi:MAG: hypothetical protein M3Z92_09125 [Bacteroidota bacterium]|nr:hypothetical protein [Bacteroidota bacterium]MDQ6889178.1 hypothetical protein [Bacteroidota bacterium]
MKKFISILSFVFVSNHCFSQLTAMNEFNNGRTKITKRGMEVLAAWGGANLIYSLASVGAANGSEKYFHKMNSIWGGVNFSLGAIGYFISNNPNGLSFSQSLRKQMTIEKIFIFNTGLDVAYITGGFYLKEKANDNSANRIRYKGYGNSVMLQGFALFIFDGIMYLVHQNHGKQLYKFSDKIKLNIAVNGFGFNAAFK